MKTEDQIKAKMLEIKNSEISVRDEKSFVFYATRLLEWVLE